MKKLVFTLFVAVSLLNSISAQTVSDAFRYSYLNTPATARSLGVGTAMGALGSDMSAVAKNPAGLGAFWKSEFSISLAYADRKHDATLGTQTESKVDNGFIIDNAGYVMTTRGRNPNWQAVSFGIGFNRFADYQDDLFILGDARGSIVQRWSGLALGFQTDQLDAFEAGPAFESGAIYDFEEDGIYENDYLDFEDVDLQHELSVDEKGFFNQLEFGLGANYKNKLLLGISLGFPIISFRHDRTYFEDNITGEVPVFNSLRYDEFLSTEGGGVNIKMGAIYKLDKMRLGVSVHSPSYLSLTDRFETDITYAFTDDNGSQQYTGQSPRGEFEYSLKTPWKVVGSFAYVSPKGFISADVEFIDYSSSRFNLTRHSDNQADAEYESTVNADIDEIMKPALNIHVGAELPVDAFRVRAGYTMRGNPQESGKFTNNSFHLGLGLRGEKMFGDLAFVSTTSKRDYSLYQLNGAEVPTSLNEFLHKRLVLTVGFKI